MCCGGVVCVGLLWLWVCGLVVLHCLVLYRSVVFCHVLLAWDGVGCDGIVVLCVLLVRVAFVVVVWCGCLFWCVRAIMCFVLVSVILLCVFVRGAVFRFVSFCFRRVSIRFSVFRFDV